MTSDLLRRKTVRLRERLEKIEALAHQDYQGFIADESSHDLCAFYLILAIEECINLAEHLLAENQWGVPETAGEEFELLAQRGVINSSLANEMRAAVGMRNLLVHQYADTNWSLVYAAAKDLNRLKEFLAAILRFGGLEP